MIFFCSLGGCKITSAPPVGFACECKYQVVSSAILMLRNCHEYIGSLLLFALTCIYDRNFFTRKTLVQGYWTCGAQLKKCADNEDCPGHCTDKTCCRLVLSISEDFLRNWISDTTNLVKARRWRLWRLLVIDLDCPRARMSDLLDFNWKILDKEAHSENLFISNLKRNIAVYKSWHWH